MTTPHPLGVIAPSAEAIEAVHPDFIKAGLLNAQNLTKKGFDLIRQNLKLNMTEDEGRKLALEIFQDLGITRHWHRPYVRFGKGTTLSFNDPATPDNRLALNDPCYLDLGPVVPDANTGLEYEGDYGDTFVFGANPEAENCAETCRALFREVQERWKQNPTSGQEIYAELKRRSSELGYELREDVRGHRVGDFPHHRFSKLNLSVIPFIPKDSIWILEVQILDPEKRFGAFFEDSL
jgi:hypothetical protein